MNFFFSKWVSFFIMCSVFVFTDNFCTSWLFISSRGLADDSRPEGRASCSCRLNFAAGCNYLDLDFQAAASWCLASFAPCMKTKLMLVLVSWPGLILDRIILGQRYLPRAIAQFLSFMVNFGLMVSLTLWVLLDLQLQLPPFADSCYQTLTIA